MAWLMCKNHKVTNMLLTFLKVMHNGSFIYKLLHYVAFQIVDATVHISPSLCSVNRVNGRKV